MARDKETGLKKQGAVLLCKICETIPVHQGSLYCKYHQPTPCQHTNCPNEVLGGEDMCPKHRARKGVVV